MENGAIKMKEKHQKADTRVLNDPMHDFQLVRVDYECNIENTSRVLCNLVNLS